MNVVKNIKQEVDNVRKNPPPTVNQKKPDPGVYDCSSAAEVAFNFLNVCVVILAIVIAGLGFIAWQSEIPLVSEWDEKVVKSQGLIAGILGAFISLEAWIGTFGVNNEKPKLLTAYSVINLTLIIPMFVLGAAFFVFLPRWTEASDAQLYRHMERYFRDTLSANLTDAIQNGFMCCGMFPPIYSYADDRRLPLSCCDPLKVMDQGADDSDFCDPLNKYPRTCNGKLTDFLRNIIVSLGCLMFVLTAIFVGLMIAVYFIKFTHPRGN